MIERPFSVYVHVPYCSRKCPYCDFTTYAVPKVPQDAYIDAVLSELALRSKDARFAGRPIFSVFFGGGTPSLIDPSGIKRLLERLAEIFPAQLCREISLEANPNDCSHARLDGYREAGVTRLSLGAQSLDDKQLRTLGRWHTGASVEAAVETAKAAGFRHVSIDLMFGVPGQSLEEWQVDLERSIALSVDHLSTYGLTYEKGTPFFQSVERGALKPLSEDDVADMMELTMQVLPDAGFEQYEVSNYAKAGGRSEHNQAYWKSIDYLGLGVGAHSFVAHYEEGRRVTGERWAATAAVEIYREKVGDGELPVSWSERLDSKALQFEFFFLGLRQISGVDLSEFESIFGCSAEAQFGRVIHELSGYGCLVRRGDNVKLSEKGILLADSVLEHFVVERGSP